MLCFSGLSFSLDHHKTTTKEHKFFNDVKIFQGIPYINNLFQPFVNLV